MEYIPLCLWIIQIMYCLSNTATSLYFGIAVLLYLNYTKIKTSAVGSHFMMGLCSRIFGCKSNRRENEYNLKCFKLR